MQGPRARSGGNGALCRSFPGSRDRDAIFFDSREAPPGLEELKATQAQAEVLLGDVELPGGVRRVIASPGISDSHQMIRAARDAGLEVISDIEVFVENVEAPFVAVTGSNGKSTMTTLLYLSLIHI